MDSVPRTVDPIQAAPAQPTIGDGVRSNKPVVDPSAFIFRGQRKFGVN